MNSNAIPIRPCLDTAVTGPLERARTAVQEAIARTDEALEATPSRRRDFRLQLQEARGELVSAAEYLNATLGD